MDEGYTGCFDRIISILGTKAGYYLHIGWKEMSNSWYLISFLVQLFGNSPSYFHRINVSVYGWVWRGGKKVHHTECPKKKPLTVWFNVSWNFNLNVGTKQSKIGWKFAEHWLPKAKISEPVDDRSPDFFEKFISLRQPYCFNKVHWSVKISWICKTHNCFT